MNTDVHIFTSEYHNCCPSLSLKLDGLLCPGIYFKLCNESGKQKVKKLSRLQNRVIGSLRNLRCLTLCEGLTFFRAAFAVKTLNHIMPLIWLAFL